MNNRARTRGRVLAVVALASRAATLERLGPWFSGRDPQPARTVRSGKRSRPSRARLVTGLPRGRTGGQARGRIWSWSRGLALLVVKKDDPGTLNPFLTRIFFCLVKICTV